MTSYIIDIPGHLYLFSIFNRVYGSPCWEIQIAVITLLVYVIRLYTKVLAVPAALTDLQVMRFHVCFVFPVKTMTSICHRPAVSPQQSVSPRRVDWLRGNVAMSWVWRTLIYKESRQNRWFLYGSKIGCSWQMRLFLTGGVLHSRLAISHRNAVPHYLECSTPLFRTNGVLRWNQQYVEVLTDRCILQRIMVVKM